MPKKRRTTKPAARRKTKKGQTSWKSFFILTIAIVVAALIYWFWLDITNWITSTWESLLELLGVGLALIAIALGTMVWIIWQGKLSLVTAYWNWWLGGTSLALAAWGLAAFFAPGTGIISQATLGGKFGSSITTSSPTVGGLRLFGLIFLGILFIDPRWTWHSTTAGASRASEHQRNRCWKQSTAVRHF